MLDDYKVETVEREGFSLTVYWDDTPESPREWDNLSTLVCESRDYSLGDVNPRYSSDDIEESAREDASGGVYLLARFVDYGSGGARFYVEDDPELANCYLYVTPERIRAEYGTDDNAARLRAADLLRGEVETMDTYVSGEVYGWAVERDGEDVDSVWGFYGLDYAREEGSRALDWAIETARREHEEKLKSYIRSRVPLIYRWT